MTYKLQVLDTRVKEESWVYVVGMIGTSELITTDEPEKGLPRNVNTADMAFTLMGEMQHAFKDRKFRVENKEFSALYAAYREYMDNWQVEINKRASAPAADPLLGTYSNLMIQAEETLMAMGKAGVYSMLSTLYNNPSRAEGVSEGLSPEICELASAALGREFKADDPAFTNYQLMWNNLK